MSMDRGVKMTRMIKCGFFILFLISIPSVSQSQDDFANKSDYNSTIGVIKDNTDQINKIKNEVDRLKTSINDNRVQIKNLKEDIKSLRTSIASLTRLIEIDTKNLSGQITSTIKETAQRIEKIGLKHSTLKQKVENLLVNQNNLKQQLAAHNKVLIGKIDSIETAHGVLVNDINDLSRNTEKVTTTIQKDIYTKSFFAGFTISLTFLIIIVLSILFHRKFKKVNVVEGSINIDTKLSEMLENQLVLMKGKSFEEGVPRADEEVDHSLPISVGTEIFRMRKRIENMDENTKGINALKNAITRLEDEFNQQGYSINDLTGKPYVDELTVKIVNSIERDDLEPETQIISRMITPQICYNSVAVSHGEIELAVSSKNVR